MVSIREKAGMMLETDGLVLNSLSVALKKSDYETADSIFGDIEIRKDGNYVCDLQVMTNFTEEGKPSYYHVQAVKIINKPREVKTLFEVVKDVTLSNEVVSDVMASLNVLVKKASL